MKQHWNHHLPTPKTRLLILLENGEVVRGIRPSYISDRKNADQGYRTHEGAVINNVNGWCYE